MARNTHRPKSTHRMVPGMAEAKTHKIDNNVDFSRRARYEKLVASLYQDVYRYRFWLCKSQPLAEDLIQETFLRAWRSLDSLKNDNAAKAWLFTILRRENARLYENYRPERVDSDEQVIGEKESIESHSYYRSLAVLAVKKSH